MIPVSIFKFHLKKLPVHLSRFLNLFRMQKKLDL